MTDRLARNFVTVVALAVFLAAVRLPGLLVRSIWYDEAITILDTAGNPAPTWPRTVVPASVAKRQFVGDPSMVQIAENLRRYSVHPPLFAWILSRWRNLLGPSLEAARLFSLMCSVGAGLALLALLRFGEMKYPLIPTVVYGLATFSVKFGHDARFYALALLFVMGAALLAYVAWIIAHEGGTRAWAYAVGAGLCVGAAFGTSYLALFPGLAVLLWFFLSCWGRARLLGVVPALAASPLVVVSFGFAVGQLGSRPDQFAGYPGCLEQVGLLVWMNLSCFYHNMHVTPAGRYTVWALLAFLGCLSATQALRSWSGLGRRERRLLTLMVAIGIAPSAGSAFLNFLFDKHLSYPHYMGYALPSLALAVSYGITQILSSRRMAGAVLLAVLLLAQASGVNWGQEQTLVWGDTTMRSFAKAINASAAPSQVVVIGTGWGRGYPGQAAYELGPETMVMMLHPDAELDEVLDQVAGYEEVCLMRSGEGPTHELEIELSETLAGMAAGSESLRLDRTQCWRISQ